MSPTPGTLAIRPVRPEDVPAVVAMVHELAEYERAPHLCRLTEDQLRQALFPPPPPPAAAATAPAPPATAPPPDTPVGPAVFGHVATIDGVPQGFTLWFRNFSSWEGVHGIYLEDLFVRPAARGQGAGLALLAALAQECVRRGYSRLEWWVLHWNPTRDFYHSIGAVHMDEWLPYRLAGPALRRLAASAGGGTPAGAASGIERAPALTDEG